MIVRQIRASKAECDTRCCLRYRHKSTPSLPEDTGDAPSLATSGECSPQQNWPVLLEQPTGHPHQVEFRIVDTMGYRLGNVRVGKIRHLDLDRFSSFNPPFLPAIPGSFLLVPSSWCRPTCLASLGSRTTCPGVGCSETGHRDRDVASLLWSWHYPANCRKAR